MVTQNPNRFEADLTGHEEEDEDAVEVVVVVVVAEVNMDQATLTKVKYNVTIVKSLGILLLNARTQGKKEIKRII